MRTLTPPDLTEPARSQRKYVDHKTQTEPKTKEGVALQLVTEEYDVQVEVNKYTKKRKSNNTLVESWKESGGMAYYLVIFPYPPEAVTELHNQKGWPVIEENKDVITLLLKIRNLSRNKTKRTQGTMALAESDSSLFILAQKKGQSCDDYYRLLKAHVNTINVHDRAAGLRLVICTKHLVVERKSTGLDNEAT